MIKWFSSLFNQTYFDVANVNFWLFKDSNKGLNFVVTFENAKKMVNGEQHCISNYWL